MHRPAELIQSGDSLSIPKGISLEFSAPERVVCGGEARPLASFVLVPEAAVNKDRGAAFGKH
jgi:hypothetical protein